MVRKFILPLLAAALLLFAVFHVVRAQQDRPKTAPPYAPAQTPFAQTVAGAGIVEANTENISVGSALPGVVTRVCVKVGDRMKGGQPLFQLDDRQLTAELKVREANLAAAEAQLARLDRMPRKEELPASEAKVREAQANVTDQEDQLKRTRTLFAGRAVGEEELMRRQQAYHVAKAQLARAQADYN